MSSIIIDCLQQWLSGNQPTYSYLPTMKTQTPTSTDSSMKHMAAKVPSDGATSFEAKSLQCGHEQLPATTVRDNPDLATTQHCGQGKQLTKCGPCFEPSGYAKMENYMENTTKKNDL
jgi:hypothetical protein